MVNYRDNVAGYVLSPSEDAALHTRFGYRATKRVFDVLVSLVTLILAAVPMLLIAIVICSDSEGGAVFKQRRVGRDGKLFYIYKFRTMKTSAPSEKATNDFTDSCAYITKAGELLRRTSLDELPQLINVLKGDMSIVGPRPLIVGETDIHEQREAAGVYSVRPGLTGWAQVNGRDNVTIEEKVRYDAEYVERRSLMLDASIIVKTIGVVLKKDGYSEGGSNDSKAAGGSNDSKAA